MQTCEEEEETEEVKEENTGCGGGHSSQKDRRELTSSMKGQSSLGDTIRTQQNQKATQKDMRTLDDVTRCVVLLEGKW